MISGAGSRKQKEKQKERRVRMSTCAHMHFAPHAHARIARRAVRARASNEHAVRRAVVLTEVLWRAAEGVRQLRGRHALLAQTEINQSNVTKLIQQHVLKEKRKIKKK